jgi:hypothetical protein
VITLRCFMSKIREFFEKTGIERKNQKTFLLFLVAVALATFFLINTQFLSAVTPVMFVVVFGIFFSALWFVAGYSVFRSLLVASVGLSFILFIGQSYCALPEVDRVANDSLMTLVGFGFIYIGVQFVQSLYKELFGDKQAKEEWRQKGMIPLFKEMNGNKHSWLVLLTYGALISLFIWQIYSVIKPIIDGLCIYQ